MADVAEGCGAGSTARRATILPTPADSGSRHVFADGGHAGPELEAAPGKLGQWTLPPNSSFLKGLSGALPPALMPPRESWLHKKAEGTAMLFEWQHDRDIAEVGPANIRDNVGLFGRIANVGGSSGSGRRRADPTER